MPNEKDTIKTLDAEQKRALAASLRSLSSPWAAQVGIPPLRISDAAEVNAESGRPFPGFAALANSWNRQLVGDAARELAALARERSADLLQFPRAGVACSPFREGLSEDPFLAGICADALCRGSSEAGVTPCLAGFALNDEDVAEMDVAYDPRALHEIYLGGLRAMEKRKGSVFSSSFAGLRGTYSEVNASVILPYLRERAGDSGFVICDKVEAGREIECLTAGNLLSDSDPDALRTLGETELDGAAERAVALAELCRAERAAAVGTARDSEISLRAAEESIVLLKNKGILPLAKGCKVAVIGHPDGMSAAEFRTSLEAYGVFESVGSAPGYLLGTERSDEEIPYACRLAEKADVVLLFLRRDSQTASGGKETRAKLPANRRALLDALAVTNPNVIAVLPPDEPVDFGFEKDVFALLLAETKCERGDEALLNVLSGKTSPSGRLASTCYADPDARRASLTQDRNSGKSRIGVFVGYRGYDTAGEHVVFPFGFGLGYTSFRYSDLTIADGKAFVTVRNRGKRAGSEVVQMYVGKADSAVVRPRKELKGFQKIFLEAGESVRLTFPIEPELLAVYNNGNFVVENGRYRVYFASSVSDVRLETDIFVKGGALVPDGGSVADYIPSMSDILSGNYTLAPVRRRREQGVKHLKTAKILLLVSLIGEGFITVLGVSNLLMDQLVNNIAMSFFFFVFPPMLIAGIVLLIVGTKQRNRRPVLFETLSDGCLSKQKEISPETSFEELFEETTREDSAPAESERDESADALKYCDAELGFAEVCERLAAFAAERGISLGLRGARKVLAAFCASRLIVCKGVSAMQPRFFEMLSEYFGTRLFLHECADGERTGVGSVEERESARSNAEKAFRDALSNRPFVHIAAWSCASAADVAAVSESFAGYFQNPRCADRRLGTEKSERSALSPNVWFLFSWNGRTESGAALPETACLIDLELAETEAREEKTTGGALNYYQLVSLAAASGREFCLDEEQCWRKIDRLEQTACAQNSFRIDQRTWIDLERFSSVFLACGGEQQDALDCALSAVLLPRMSCLRSGTETAADLGRAMEKIFGAHVPECRKVLTDLSASNV